MVYIDLLIINDFFLNYVILMSTSILLNRMTKFKKIFLSSAIGTIPLLFLFINLNQIIIFMINIIFAFFMSVISFKYIDIIYTIKNIIYMYFISIFLAGSLYLINVNLLPKLHSAILNTVFLIIISPIITYIFIKTMNHLKINYSNYYKVDIYFRDKPMLTLNSFLDTGNNLVDPYTRKPVILITANLIKITSEKIVLVPYNTIDNHGFIKCFSPEKIYIHNVGYREKVLIGLIDKVNIEGAECILQKKLIERI